MKGMHSKLQCFAVIAVPLALAYFIFENINAYLTFPQSFPLREWTEGLRVALDLKTKMNETWANLTVVVLGFLWLIWVVGRTDYGRLMIQTLPDKLLFFYANISYLLSYLAYFFWADGIIRSYWDASIGTSVPDVTSDFLECFSRSQFIFFVFGIICTGLLLWFTKAEARSS